MTIPLQLYGLVILLQYGQTVGIDMAWALGLYSLTIVFEGIRLRFGLNVFAMRKAMRSIRSAHFVDCRHCRHDALFTIKLVVAYRLDFSFALTM